MKKLFILALLVLFALVALQLDNVLAQKKFSYLGVAGCKMCHKLPKSGDQYTQWEKSAHAKAYTTLATAKAIEVAKKVGVTEPQKSPKCLKCHVTGFEAAAAQKGPKLTLEEGVSCEACHGAGSDYKTMGVMKAVYAGTQKAAEVGLVEPTKEVCVKCHNPESPTYQAFDFATQVKLVTHPVPKK